MIKSMHKYVDACSSVHLYTYVCFHKARHLQLSLFSLLTLELSCRRRIWMRSSGQGVVGLQPNFQNIEHPEGRELMVWCFAKIEAVLSERVLTPSSVHF